MACFDSFKYQAKKCVRHSQRAVTLLRAITFRAKPPLARYLYLPPLQMLLAIAAPASEMPTAQSVVDGDKAPVAAVAPQYLSPAHSCVVLLHGLARTEHSMNKMAKALSLAGYFVVNQAYPSRKHPIQHLANVALTQAIAKCGAYPQLHFVTHSMGGILLRYYWQTQPIEKLRRVVMLGPPNRGSQVVDRLRNVPGFRLINGPAGLQLGTDKHSLPLQLGPAQGEVGIIAGSRSINWLLSLYLPNPDDGKVSVANTQLAEMKDHLVVKVSHPFLMRNKHVIAQVIYFLQQGKFKPQLEQRRQEP